MSDGEREESRLRVVGGADDGPEGDLVLESRARLVSPGVVADDHQALGGNSDVPELASAAKTKQGLKNKT